ncbi:MAG: hypothetical protein SFV81_02020 [Pirellulaceae bacterium]|nr:hypothetical protein [Pirellulaceae bacterium]
MLRTLAFWALAAFFLPGETHAQSKADRRDEKRENERVQNAKDDLQRAQRELAMAIRDFRLHSADLRQTEASLRSTQLKYSQAREAAEERLAENSGLPDAIRKMRGIRDQIDSLTKPIVDELHKSQKWLTATQKANDAKAIREQLLADESRTDSELEPQLAELEKLIAVPAAMESAAVDADPKLKQLKLDYHAALDVIADLRRKLDTSKIDADPEVKSGRSAVEGIERELNRKRKSLAALNTKVAHAQGDLANANKKLQQAQAADQKDSNNKKKN